MTEPATRPLAVVTGASTGIGYELAAQFAKNGFDVIAAADESSIHTAARQLSLLGTDVTPAQVDLAEYAGVEKLWEVIRESGRPVDAAAMNAGVAVHGEFARDTELQDELRLINLNITSAVHLTKRLLPGMVERGQGRLLFTSSIAARIPATYTATYGGSKAFLLSFAEAIRNELKDTGVTVTALMPGPTDTKFFERAGMEDTRVGQQHKDDPADVAQAGYEALMAGKDHVVASSLKSKVMGAAGKLMPEPLKAEQHRKLAEPPS
jgi:short-subunit dehydrogenase